jgi:hypothetical protein
MWEGIALGAVVGGGTGATTLFFLRWGLTKSFQVMLTIFMSGMLLRLVLIAIVTSLVLSQTSIARVPFIGSMLTSYLIFLGLEIAFILRQNR